MGQILSPAQGSIWQGPDSSDRQSRVWVPWLPAAHSPAPRDCAWDSPTLSVFANVGVLAGGGVFVGRIVGFSVTPGLSVRLLPVVHRGPRGQSPARRCCQPQGASPGWERFPPGWWPCTGLLAGLSHRLMPFVETRPLKQGLG